MTKYRVEISDVGPPIVNACNVPGLSFETYENTNARRAGQRLYYGQDGCMMYELSNFGKDSLNCHPVDYYVGVINHKQKKISFVRTPLFKMRSFPEDSAHEAEQPVEEIEYLKALDNLTDTFGTHQRKKAKVSREKQRIHVQRMLGKEKIRNVVS